MEPANTTTAAAAGEPNYSPPTSPSSRKIKFKTSLCLPSPFRKHHHHHNNHVVSANASPADHRSTPSSSSASSSDHPLHHKSAASLSRSSSALSSPTAAWIRSRAHDFMSRIGRHGNNHDHGQHHGHGHGGGHRRRHSMSPDFHYDASSYALNFDPGNDESQVDEFPMRSFSARLPPSPTREIECAT